MDSVTKNAHTWKIARFNLFLFFSFFSPSHLPSPCPSFPFTHFVSACHGRNDLRIYTPDSLLSCITRLIPKFLKFLHWSPCPFFHFLSPRIFSSFISKFILLFFFLFPPFPLFLLFSLPFPSLPFPFFFTLIFFPSPKSLWFLPPPLWGGEL